MASSSDRKQSMGSAMPKNDAGIHREKEAMELSDEELKQVNGSHLGHDEMSGGRMGLV